MKAYRIMMVAGEASGDTLAAELIQALNAEVVRRRLPVILQFGGAGGPRMAAVGARLKLDLTAHAVVGVWEVLKHYGKFRDFFYLLLREAQQWQPDVIVLVDYPGFNLRFARAIQAWSRSFGGPFHNWRPRLVYYVSPQVWAWHESRVRQIARDVDLMLAIFPFEKAWYAERVPQLPVVYVGHPLLDRHAAAKKTAQPCQAAPSALPRVLLLPGSRVRELKKHLPVMLEAARLIQDQVPSEFRLIAPNEDLAKLARSLVPTGLTLDLRVGGLGDALSNATVAIASSGTVTMECAFYRVPTVVLYKVARPTYWLGRRFIRVKHIAMPNLLAGEALYPEYIQDMAEPGNLAQAVIKLLQDPAGREAIQRRLDQVIESLGQPGASTRAARAILDQMNCG
ncbi:MAG TPA: lipid-A-disaccharide synthase [Candidatus Paceibacterota bacterium]|nr:lipid-A-disaccharide synthase [Verrucomicrobiota bacterium]HRY52129.1 lipid-A-disaccharide synthase [Candidatus Paceibacterota bacterium]HSA01243.1 lipid-A-disaccharide synthase [Candidatus Paceibacterota bacterium]